jgi:hypothetical protein
MPLFFRLLTRGEFCISGFTNASLRQQLPGKSSGWMTRLLKRLRVHGLIKKVSQRYKYYLTEFGRQVVTMALKLREMVIIPELAYGRAAWNSCHLCKNLVSKVLKTYGRHL